MLRATDLASVQPSIGGELFSPFAISIALGLDQDEISGILSGKVHPSAEQREKLEGLIAHYRWAIRIVNVEVMKHRLSAT